MADLSRQYITRRNFLLGLGTVSATGMLVACGANNPAPAPASNTPGAQAQPATTQPITLRMQARTGAEEDFWVDRAEAFNKL